MKNIVALLFTALLLLAFFLPWIGLHQSTLNAWQIPVEASSLKGIIPESDPVGYTKIMYLLPVLCVLGLCRELLGLRWVYWEYPASLLVALCFFCFKKSLDYEEAAITFRIGYFLSIACAIGGWLNVMAQRRKVK